MSEWSSVRYLDDDGDGYGGVPFVELSEVVRRMDEHAATVERLRAEAITAVEKLLDHTEPWASGPTWAKHRGMFVTLLDAALSESQP